MNYKLTNALCIVAMLLTTMNPVVSAEAPKYNNPTGNQLPIMAWYSIQPDSEQTAQRYQELAEAGFNLSYAMLRSTQSVTKAINASRGTGVKLFVSCPELTKTPETTVNSFKNDEQVAGWFLCDEPKVPKFQELVELSKRVLAVDTTHLLYMNLFPIDFPADRLGAPSYRDYVEQYARELAPGYLSFDHYPVVDYGKGITLRPRFYENLEIMLALSRRYHMPFWAFALATAHEVYPVPTREHLRLQVFSNLAYGAQGIQYFTYWQPGAERWDFHNAPIDEKGQRTNVWYLLRDLNREISALSYVFLGAEVIDVSHTGVDIPQGTHRLASLPYLFAGLQTSGEGVLVSHLRNGSKHYLMIVNRDVNRSQHVRLRVHSSVERILPDGTPTAVSSNSQTLRPGDYLLYRWE